VNCADAASINKLAIMLTAPCAVVALWGYKLQRS